MSETGHFTTPVRVNGQGPFDFVVDTAASGSAVSTAFAERLKLKPDAEGAASMHGASGSQQVRLFTLETLESPAFNASNVRAGALSSGSAVVEDGILGMPLFAEGRLEFDVAGKRLKVGPSGPAPAGFATAPATKAYSVLMIVDVVVDGVKAKALFDSGARRTIVNPALQAALGIKADDPRLTLDQPVHGATTQTTAAYKTTLRDITIGGAVFEKPDVIMADAPVFKLLGLSDQPAIILGSNVLSKARAFAVDYPRSEVQIRR